MPRDDPHSIHNEPHLRPSAGRLDPSERRAGETLSREKRKRAADEDGHGHSVYDEPDVFPGREITIIDQDWMCSGCGYNLRGLEAHHPCPECGHRELYRPPPAGAASYGAWLSAKMEATTPLKSWTVAVLAAVIGGIMAVFAALTHADPMIVPGMHMLVLVIVIGPTMEEAMKVGTALFIIETRPYLFRSVGQIQFATIGSAFLFAAIENVMYLTISVPNHSTFFAVWRWTVCVALHVGCTLVASRGGVAIWQRTMAERRKPRLGIGLRPVIVAIAIHGFYNASMVAWESLP